MPSTVHAAPAPSSPGNPGTLSWQSGVDWPAVCAARPTSWTQAAHLGSLDAAGDVSATGLDAAERRRAWWAPLLAQLFPDDLAASAGLIESPLWAVPALQSALGLPATAGALFVRADHALPVAGSVKARGGIHEVLQHAEALAVRHGLLPAGAAARAAVDSRLLATPSARALFGAHQVAVGSTGNLGLAIGVMAAALGFQAVVHMSADAKDWKRQRLRQRGVQVVEHAGDYAEAVAAGRAAALAQRAAAQGEPPSVHDIGLSNRTEADGLAGPAQLWRSAAGRAWLQHSGVAAHLARTTHIAWTTGGQAVPAAELARFRSRAVALAATPADEPALRPAGSDGVPSATAPTC